MKKTNKVNLKLARKMAESVAGQINHFGLEAPSEAAWTTIEDIIESFYHLDDFEKVEKDLRKKIDAMTYKDAMKLEEKVNQLLETGDYD